MKKRLLGLTLACSMAAMSLAGCSGGSGTETTAASAAETTKAAETTSAAGGTAETTAAPAAEGDTVLKWAVWDIAATVYYQPLIDAFEAANPGVKIEMVDLGSTDYQTVLATELTGSGSDFDIVAVKDVPGYMTLVNKGVLEPLDDYIAKDSVDLAQYGGIADQLNINGNIFELPFIRSFWVLFYNKDVFDNAGVEYPTNDMTFEQYDALARSVTNTTPGEEVYGTHYHTWRSTVQLFGILDGKNTIVDGTYDFLKPYYEMILAQQEDGVCQDYATLKTSSLHYSGAFAQGNVAMLNMGSWFIPTLIEKIKTGEYGPEVANWGLVKYPHAEGVEPGTTLAQITSVAIPTSAPHKDQAWEFVKFVTGAEGAEIVANTGNFPAVTTDAVIEAISSIEGFPQDEASAEALNTVQTYLEMPVHEKSSEIETVLNEAHDNIMTEGSSIDEGIEEMNAGVQAILGQ